MENRQLTLDREKVLSYFNKWSELEHEIQDRYDAKDPEVSIWMTEAIANYEELLQICAKVGGTDRKTKMEPLNGEERLQFIKDKIVSPFALVQLNLLYTELRKKVARFII